MPALTGDLARPLALARIGLGVGTVLFALEMAVVLSRIAHGAVRLPVLPGVPDPTIPTVLAVTGLMVLAGICLAVGLFARPAAWAATLLNVALLLWDQQAYSHHAWLLTSLLPWLALSAPDRALAVRRVRHCGPAAAWAPMLLMTQLSLCYLFAGASKLNEGFLSGEPFAQWLRLDLPIELHQGLAVGAVGTELFLAFALWFRRTRRLGVAAGVGLHLSILVLMPDGTLPFAAFAVICLSLYPLFGRLAEGQADSMSGPETGVTIRSGGTMPESASTSSARHSSSSNASSGGGPSSTVTTQS
ncbi:HTTM domain-containing protein [Nocardioides donggukensis]|uniref:HTTM domain-containing protein n=1 Tax=Nocardioides donggukensis TaxID=2774019 RepID=A0A927PYX1_9ACTN|nr:HTTM domain-containing protein [Nocardioides donggukensis]MBD8869143.1 HTTM domain-containing protein [Nocardioides donggukensis]